MKAKTNIGKQNKQAQSAVMERATRRLKRDLIQIHKEPLSGVTAAPLEKNIFIWHCNIAGPKDTVWQGGIFHLILNFPRTYPDDPPELTLCTRVSHPNVDSSNRVCLDLLQRRNPSDKEKYAGWSSSYTVQTILVQLQAFLFEAEVSKALANITDPKQYEKQKKEWLSAVQFSVEQSRSFNCTSCSHRSPRAIWPPFADQNALDKAAQELSALKPVDLVKNELVCFYTRQTYQEDVLGVGVTFSKNVRTGEIKSIQSPLDLVSLRAFMNHDLRLSSTNEKFTHWLPLFLNPEHGVKAMHLAKRALSIICTGTNKNFKEDQILNVIPRLMSTMVVEVMSGKAHASIKALRGYCLFHRLLLAFVKEFPSLREFCNEQVGKFIKDEKARHKDIVPNLGELLCLLAISDKYTWADIKDAYLEESTVRNVFWILNKYPELEQETHPEITSADRLKYSFEVSKVSQKLCAFHQWFLENVAHPANMNPDDIAKRYDENFGRPANNDEDQFLLVVDQISKFASYKDFYTYINKPLSDEDIVKSLIAATKKSKEKGYHGTTLSVLTPEEFAKENKAVDLSKLVSEQSKTLIDNEAMWQEMSSKRWGFTSLPDYLQNVTTPWRKLYLQNNIQDLVAKLNESQDFKTFHDTIDLSAEIPRLELITFNPSNLTSKFHFLTALLIKLKNLDTLIIRKGEAGLGVKGFKALIKGLSMNPGCLKTLILEGCDLDARSIEELTKSKLVSSNLQTLILVGNPLGDNGAEMLASFLIRHQNLPHLTELDVTDCSIADRGARALAEAMLVKKELTTLKVMKNNISNGLTDVMKNLAYNPSLKSVDASRVSGSFSDNGRDSLGKLVKLSVSLQELNLWRVAAVANLDAQVFNELKENTTLKVLDISETGFNRMELFGVSFTKNNTLEKLLVCGNNINCSSIFNMVEELKKAKPIKEDKQGKSPVAPKDDLSLTDDIRKFNITLPLKYLDMNHNNFSYAIKQKHKSILGELIMYCKNLTFLNLSHCGLEKDHMVSIGEALRENTSIVELILRKNRIGKYGLKPMILGLKENKTLQKLDLSGNELGVLGAASLAAILDVNTGLKDVNIFSNFIEIEGCELLCAALAKNTTLTSLDMGLNRIRVRGGEAVVKLLSKNTSLTRIALKHNRLTDKLGMQIASAIVNNKESAVKYLSLAGNYLSTIIRSEISSMLNLSGRGITFDLSKIVEFKDPERQERTVYITPLPCNVTEAMIKKLFYENKCGVCLNVNIYKHKTKKDKNKVKYAFVEFAHPDSIQLALRLGAKKLNKIAGNPVSIMRAGIQQNTEEEEKPQRGVSSGRGRGAAVRGGRGRGRGAPRARGRGRR